MSVIENFQEATTALMTLLSSSIDVRNYGAVGDGLTDDTAAIEAAIADIPIRTWYPVAGTNRPQHGGIVYFPTPASAYRITRKINIPNGKSVRFLAPLPNSSRIWLDNPQENYAFHVEAGSDTQKSIVFENLILDQGGIEWERNARCHNTVMGCRFARSKEWAIRTLGESCIDFAIARCYFDGGVGGINIAYQQSDIWSIRDCTFIRNSGIDLRIATSGVRVENCDFEVKPDAAYDQPFVNLDNDPSGVRPGNQILFYGNRFGNEPRPPRDLIVIGSVAGASRLHGTGSIWFLNNLFRGANGMAPTDYQGKNVFLLNQPPQGLMISQNAVWKYGNLINEAYLSITGGAPPLRNRFLYNELLYPEVPVFTNGGLGWTKVDG